TPQEIYDEGCPCEPQEHELTVWNNTGYDTDVNLSYTLVQGDGTCQGPASVFLPDGANMAITVELYPQGEPGDIVECEIYAEDASQPENNDISWIIKELFEGAFYWEQIATEPDSGRMDNVLAGYDGLVWSITGYGLNANVRNYDPETNTWSTVAGSTAPFGINYARSGCHPYGSEAANKVFVYGDSTTSGFTGLWSYDMDANVWTNETPSGTPPAQTGIWAPAWTYDPDDQLCYMTGGATAPGGGDLTPVYIYDPLTNSWLDPLPNFTTNRAFHAAFMYDGMVCVMGGIDVSSVVHSSTQCYADGSWNAENADIPALPMGWWGMGYASKVHFGSDLQLWLIGGADTAFEIINNTYYYDVNAGTWEEGGPLASGSFYRTAATNLDGDLYHVGGSVGGFSYSGLSDHHVQIACEPCPVEECTWVELVVEDFEAWPPADWTIIDYGGTCVWESSQTTGRSNYAGGDGYAADADADWCGSGSTMDTGLQTPHFNLSHALEARLEYVASYNYLSGSEFAAVNFNQSGDWTTLLFWQEDHDAYGPGEFVSLDLPVGDPDAFVEFHYYSPAWNWWYMVDQVVVSACVTEIPALEAWKEAPTTAEPGETITYTIYIEAQQLIDGMSMVDPLPAGVEYAGNLEWTDGEAWYDADDNTVYWEYYETEAVGEPVSPSPAVYDPAAVADLVGGVEPSGAPLPQGDVKTFSYPLSVLWDNGPLVTHPGGGYNGHDASALQTALGLNTYGFGNQFALGYRMADDFEITDPTGWWIDTIT
ncbi:MAG: hypothetical protein IBX69_18450, partial [Anaerolineales bacterium]|nr:hypothetical protein [Anaerolineales bacterium]